MRLLLATLLLGAAAFAQSIDSVQPECAAPGDPVLICGEGFGDEPRVLFGAFEADVLRAMDTKILVEVPGEAEPGETTIQVGSATAPFVVLAKGAPVIQHLSSSHATPGMIVVIVGANLRDGIAHFLDAGDNEVANAALVGEDWVAYLKVPTDIPVGTYTLVVVNGDGLDSGACSPEITIHEPGEPAVASIEPEEQRPGRPVTVEGTDLGPIGFAVTLWTDPDGETLATLGFANGFDMVLTNVPFQAEGGVTYDVVVEFADGTSTEASGAFRYEVGSPPDPTIEELEYDSGPAGSLLAIFGEGLLGDFFGVEIPFPVRPPPKPGPVEPHDGDYGPAVPAGAGPGGPGSALELPKVEFTRDGVSTEAEVLYGCPGFGFTDDILVVRVPSGLEDGDYTVTVTVGEKTSNGVVFTVMDLPLSVESMLPDSHDSGELPPPVWITGTGFGVPGIDVLEVAWEDAEGTTWKGRVLHHTDRELLVLLPGWRSDPLPKGEYTVRITKNPGTGAAESVVAGPYTVH